MIRVSILCLLNGKRAESRPIRQRKMVGGFGFSSFGRLKKLYSRVLSYDHLIQLGNTTISSLHPVRSATGFVGLGSLFTFLFAFVFACFYLVPSSRPTGLPFEIPNASNNRFDSTQECNVFDGKWVVDDNYPLYNASECPFAESGFNCLANGRKDKGYLKWRWKPRNCDIPRFDVNRVLDYLRGKRVVFVGDSLSRSQWESFICMLMTGIKDKRTVYEVNGNKITKRIRFLGVRFSSHNFTVDFYRSVFLVLPGHAPRRAPKRVKSTIRLDKMDDISKEWIDSDILVFNSGHWWTRSKLFEEGAYFQVGRWLKLGMPIPHAFKHALTTWASWVDSKINPKRSLVFFRTFEYSHWSKGHKGNTCKVTRRPMSNIKEKDKVQLSEIGLKVVKNMTVPVKALDVTSMGAYRSDGHVGIWSGNPSVPDCSHWCLPGVPDMWNEILLSHLLTWK